jgi:hypothetical protein
LHFTSSVVGSISHSLAAATVDNAAILLFSFFPYILSFKLFLLNEEKNFSWVPGELRTGENPGFWDKENYKKFLISGKDEPAN